MRPVIYTALLLLSSAPLSGCYLLKQGAGQLQLLMRREPVAQVLASPKTTADEKHKLQVIAEAKRYAETQIGLKRTNSYGDFVPLDRDAVSYVVSAAPKDKLVGYTWWYPLIGNLPYKGFFDKRDAIAEQARMKALDYDTILRGVPAFSMLGIVADPIYSPFLKYDVTTLSNIIIHELTHATLFLPGQGSFNEGFATFVGNTGSQAFLAQRFGADSAEAKAARDAATDNTVFTEYIQAVSHQLEALYGSNRSRADKLAARERIFAEAKQAFKTDYEPRMPSHQFRHFPDSTLNNAALISYRTYYNRLDRFERAYQLLGSDLRRTVVFFKDTVARSKDPERFLDDWIRTQARAPGDKR